MCARVCACARVPVCMHATSGLSGTVCALRVPEQDMVLPLMEPGVDIHYVQPGWVDLPDVLGALLANQTAIRLAAARGARMRALMSQRGLACYLRQALACWSSLQVRARGPCLPTACLRPARCAAG